MPISNHQLQSCRTNIHLYIEEKFGDVNCELLHSWLEEFFDATESLVTEGGQKEDPRFNELRDFESSDLETVVHFSSNLASPIHSLSLADLTVCDGNDGICDGAYTMPWNGDMSTNSRRHVEHAMDSRIGCNVRTNGNPLNAYAEDGCDERSRRTTAKRREGRPLGSRSPGIQKNSKHRESLTNQVKHILPSSVSCHT